MVIKQKLLFLAIILIGLTSAVSVSAANICPSDNGAGVVCSGGTPWFCGGSCVAAPQCTGGWTASPVCASGFSCPNVATADLCGYAATCDGTHSRCGAWPNYTCTTVTVTPTAPCNSYDSCNGYCNGCQSGYTICGSTHTCIANLACLPGQTFSPCTNSCTGTASILKLGYDSVSGTSVIQSAAYPSLFIPSSGYVGIGTTVPNDIFSITNTTSAAPAGSAGTGHNYTSTYLSSDDYALANTGYVKSLIGSATSTMPTLWGGTAGGNIWNTNSGNVGIGTNNPGAKLDVVGGSVRTDNQLISTAGYGIAPLNVVSTTTVANLSAASVGYVGIGTSTTSPSSYPASKLSFTVFALPEFGAESGALTVRGWSDSYYSWQMIGNNTPWSRPEWYLRTGQASWGNTYKIWHSGNLTNNLATSSVVKWNGSSLANSIMYDDGTNVGIGSTIPNDIFSITNTGIAAPAGSSGTGHNYTSTYLSTDNYALANTGYVKSLIGAATSTITLWGGTTGGNIWGLNSGSVGIGTTNPTGKLDVVGIDNLTTTNIIAGYANNLTQGFAMRYNGLYAIGSNTNVDINLIAKGTGNVITPSTFYVNNYSYLNGLRIGGSDANNTIWNGNNDIGITANTGYKIYLSQTSAHATGLTIDTTNGYVGIGTTNPNSTLNVLSGTVAELRFNSGAASLTPTLAVGNTNSGGKFAALVAGTNGSAFVFDNSGSFAIGGEAKADYTNGVINGGTQYLTILPSGNVGIGTTNPAMKFHIATSNNKTTATTNYASFISTNEALASGPFGLRTTITGATSLANRYALLQTTDYNTADGGNLVMQTGGGNVGIGTSTPTEKLSLVSGASDIFSMSGGSISSGFIFSTSWSASSSDYLNIRSSANNNLQFTLTRNGYVGINTLVPNDLFTIGTGGIAAPSGSAGTGHNYTSTYLAADSYALTNVGYVNSLIGAATSTITLWGGSTSGNVWNLNSGNVGIGTSTPTAKLDLTAGNFDIDNTTFANQFGVITKNGTRFIHNFNYGNNGTVTTDGNNLFFGKSSGNLTMGSTATASWQGSYNTGLGDATLQNNTTGAMNMAVGYAVLSANTTGYNNSSIGVYSLQSNTVGNNNVAIGINSLQSNVSGSGAVAIGAESQRYANSTTTAWNSHNNSVGYQALRGSYTAANNTGNYNNAFGYQALVANTSGGGNNAIGEAALAANTTGGDNQAIGTYALTTNTSGNNNIGIGIFAMGNNTSGSNSSGVGNYALQYSTTGGSNNATGFAALQYNTTGSNNNAMGTYSLQFNTTGGSNTAVGSGALFNSGKTVSAGLFIVGKSYTIISAGDTNFTSIGAANNNVGTIFTATGVGSGAGTASANSDNNIGIGSNAGRTLANGTTILSAPSNSLFIGNSTKASADGNTNENVIGYNANGIGSNSVVLGNDSILTTLLKGNVSIGSTIPNDIFSITNTGIAAPAGSSGTGHNYTSTYVAADSYALTNVGYVNSLIGAATSSITLWGGTTSGNVWNLNSGNVGIGTSTPTAKLDLTGGNFDIDNTTFANQNGIITKNGTRFIHDFNYGNNGTVTTVGYNTFLGINAGNLTMGSTATVNTDASFNTGVGNSALMSNTKGSLNSAFGRDALKLNTTGSQNAAQGGMALSANTTGSNNNAMGVYAMTGNTTGSNNTAQGAQSLWSNTTGSNNSTMGYNSLFSNVAGSNGVAIGYQSQFYANNTTTAWTNTNTSLGYQALFGSTVAANNTGTDNTAIGYQSLLVNTTGYGNVGIGPYSLVANTTGAQNVSIGKNTLTNNTSGYNNVALGDSALLTNTTGYSNMGIGEGTLWSNTTGYQNVSIGARSLRKNTTGYNNAAIGYYAGYYIADGAMSNTNSVNSLFLGNDTRPLADNQINQIVIGGNAIGVGSNSVVLGNDSILKTILKGSVGIGSTVPNDIFSITNTGTAAPAGSSGTGHNFTSTYLSTDDYALANTGYVKSLIASATSTNLWSGTKDGNIWNGTSGGGSVGIGTTNPSYNLDVVGDIHTSGNLTEKKLIFTPSTIGWYRIVTAHGLNGNKGGVVRIYSSYDNRVTDVEIQYNIGGYGTGGSIQETRYSSYNSGAVSQARIGSDGAGNDYLDIYVSSATTPGPITIFGYGLNMPVFVASPVVGATAGSTDLSVLTFGHGFRSTAGANFAETSGNVGIGTNNPNYKLDLSGAMNISNGFGTPGTESSYRLKFYDNGGVSNDTGIGLDGSAGGSEKIWFNAYNGFYFNYGTNGQKITFDSSGNVGIGSTIPNDIFSITNTGTAAPAGSSGTGHNYTSTYLSTDDYALANTGYVKTLVNNAINVATSSSAYLSLGGGTMNLNAAINMHGGSITNLSALTVTKITANTIDPLYNINNINYSTFASSISGGVKEEYVGQADIKRLNSKINEYEYIVNFDLENEGSDLWVWRKVIDYSNQNVQVFITPSGKFAAVYYVIEGNKLIFRSDKPVEISYRLIGRRFDWRAWPTKSLDQKQKGMLVN